MIDTTLQLLYGLASPFNGHPELSYLMAIGFGILFAISVLQSGKSERGTQMGILFAAFLWVIFGLLDQQFQGFEIRVDMVFSWPPVFAVSVVAAWFAIRSIASRERAYRNPDLLRDDPSLRANPHD